MSKHTSPEQFLGQSPVSAALPEKFRLNLASGALRVVEVNNKPVEHSNSLSNKEDRIAEVRGVEPHQNLEGNMIDIAQEKLSQLPGGDNYFTKAENMKRLTEIDERFKASGELTIEDIVFLRFSGPIEGFGNNRDPRIDEILQARAVDVGTDIETVLGSGNIDPTGLAHKLIERGGAYTVAHNLDKFMAAGADPTGLANQLIESGQAYAVTYKFDKFMAAGADPTGLANQLIERGGAYTVAHNLDKFMAAGADESAIREALRLA